MSDCKVYRREIEGAADGGCLSLGARAHLARCRACGDDLRQRESLRALVGGLGKVEAPADFEFRLRARMAAAKAGERRGPFSGTRWFYSFAPVAVAACFVVVSATLYYRQSARPQLTAPPPAVASASPRNAEPDRINLINNQQNNSSASLGAVIVPVNRPGAAAPKSPKTARKVGTRAVQAREMASSGARHAEETQTTLISSVTAAPVLTLKGSSEPLRVILRDERGAERVVPMRSVSFGSQDLLSRGAAPKSASNVEVGGVW